MSMAGGIFLWAASTPGGSGAFVSAPPQRDLRALAGTALLWGSAALFAPTQPTPIAAESVRGTHQAAIHQSQNRSFIRSPFQGPAVAADIVRPFFVYEQRAENPRGALRAPQIDALPILRALPGTLPQDPTQLQPQWWRQAPAEAVTQPTLIRALTVVPQADPTQIRPSLWSPAPAPFVATPAIGTLQAGPQRIDLTQQGRLWGPLPVVDPPIRPFQAEPQRVDLTQQGLWMQAPPPSIAPSAPPIMPFSAGPIAIDVAQYGQARVTFWYAPPESIAPPPPVVDQPPAGRRKRRMYVEIDGQNFEVESAEHAQALLDRAKALALRVASDKAEANLIVHLIRNPKQRPKIERPKVASSHPELQSMVREARATLTAIYANAYRDAEIRIRLAAILAEEDDDDLLILL